MFKELRDIISKGDRTDLAASVFIDAAFRATVAAFVDVVVMPVAGVILARGTVSNPPTVRAIRTALQSVPWHPAGVVRGNA